MILVQMHVYALQVYISVYADVYVYATMYVCVYCVGGALQLLPTSPVHMQMQMDDTQCPNTHTLKAGGKPRKADQRRS